MSKMRIMKMNSTVVFKITCWLILLLLFVSFVYCIIFFSLVLGYMFFCLFLVFVFVGFFCFFWGVCLFFRHSRR